MGVAAILIYGMPVAPSRLAQQSTRSQTHSTTVSFPLNPVFSSNSIPLALSIRARTIQRDNEARSDDIVEISTSTQDATSTVVQDASNNPTPLRRPFLFMLAIAVGVAAMLTIGSALSKPPLSGSSLGIQCLAESPNLASLPTGFTFKALGYRIILPECAPGWVYFWLLMAAGCGLFISEEALNIWVGITLSRLLSLDGTWTSFADSFSLNSTYIMSTIFWVYWGVCISDMVPYYLGKAFRRTGASDELCSKLGIGPEKVKAITEVVQRYGNLVGFVERFSLGIRNPTAFLAGSLGISPECFFGGVCLGGLITLPLQLGIGFLLRDRPLLALGTVASVVGIWTVLPYAIAASTALLLFLRRCYRT